MYISFVDVDLVTVMENLLSFHNYFYFYLNYGFLNCLIHIQLIFPFQKLYLGANFIFFITNGLARQLG